MKLYQISLCIHKHDGSPVVRTVSHWWGHTRSMLPPRASLCRASASSNACVSCLGDGGFQIFCWTKCCCYGCRIHPLGWLKLVHSLYFQGPRPSMMNFKWSQPVKPRFWASTAGWPPETSCIEFHFEIHQKYRSNRSGILALAHFSWADGLRDLNLFQLKLKHQFWPYFHMFSYYILFHICSFQ